MNASLSRSLVACGCLLLIAAMGVRSWAQDGANDAPTNDLDVDTLRSLEDALLEFGGCTIIISHDRWFLDRVCTHILAFEGDSHVEFFQGNFQDYEADRKRRLGDEASKPRRIKYRRLAS